MKNAPRGKAKAPAKKAATPFTPKKVKVFRDAIEKEAKKLPKPKTTKAGKAAVVAALGAPTKVADAIDQTITDMYSPPKPKRKSPAKAAPFVEPTSPMQQRAEKVKKPRAAKAKVTADTVPLSLESDGTVKPLDDALTNVNEPPQWTEQQKAGNKAAQEHSDRMNDADKNGVVLRVTRKEHGGIIIDQIQVRDREMLRLACEDAQAAGKAASTANAKALLTQAKSEADSLHGYAMQALEVLKRAAGPTLELTNGERQAALTGLFISADKLQSIADKEEERLLPDDATRDAIKEVSRLQRILRHIDAPDIFTRDITKDAPKPTPPPAPPAAAGPVVDAEPTIVHEAQPVEAFPALGSGDVEEAEFEIIPESRQLGSGVSVADILAHHDKQPADEGSDDTDSDAHAETTFTDTGEWDAYAEEMDQREDDEVLREAIDES